MMKRKYLVLISLLAVIAISFAITSSTLFGREPEHMTVVAFGDSNTAGSNWTLEKFPSESKWFSQLSAKIPQHTLINKGIGGHTTEHARLRFKRDVLTYNPDIVLIMFGTNDSRLINGRHQVSEERFLENLEYFILSLKKINAQPVLMTTIPIVDKLYHQRHPELSPSVSPKAANEEYNEITRQLAIKHKIQLVDLNKAFIRVAGGSSDKALQAAGLLDSSGTHMSPEGAKAAAKEVYEVMRKME
ncbi:SGNH/GDSL hydrolase family protein [Fictibacillus aquaticus]|uniref:SGNH hydrolase-type esterase domain-containing protein n=1 Tax=Fictibacillus aquaticus TaxID=2021314 RepID=A0A235F989_9BACL|nr:SGNH/GDSL hydrolase family protein [Fictibacillus aquaticus]OYD57739.1 hypothetical protein CGZ90_13855 [Fictibacillus aquaticus]